MLLFPMDWTAASAALALAIETFAERDNFMSMMQNKAGAITLAVLALSVHEIGPCRIAHPAGHGVGVVPCVVGLIVCVCNTTLSTPLKTSSRCTNYWRFARRCWLSRRLHQNYPSITTFPSCHQARTRIGSREDGVRLSMKAQSQ